LALVCDSMLVAKSGDMKYDNFFGRQGLKGIVQSTNMLTTLLFPVRTLLLKHVCGKVLNVVKGKGECRGYFTQVVFFHYRS